MKTSAMFKTLKITAIASLIGAVVPAYAEEEAEQPGRWQGYSVSIEGVYGNAVKRASSGGVNMVGLDMRLNYDVSFGGQASLGLLFLGGEEDIATNVDLETTNLGLLLGYRFSHSVWEGNATFFAGARIGLTYADYVLDMGRAGGWSNYAEDTEARAAYALEAGAAFAITESWKLRATYEYYGNWGNIGGGTHEYGDQQYHLFQLGAEYKF